MSGSSPYSRFNLHFNRENLEKSLNRSEIGYRYMGDKMGGRYPIPGCSFLTGQSTTGKFRIRKNFRKVSTNVLSIISSGKKIALMCAEKEPERCHRFALISPVLQSKGISVIHIRPDMKLQANEDLERELVDSFFDTSQVSITGEPVDFVALMYERVGRGHMGYPTTGYHRTGSDLSIGRDRDLFI